MAKSDQDSVWNMILGAFLGLLVFGMGCIVYKITNNIIDAKISDQIKPVYDTIGTEKADCENRVVRIWDLVIEQSSNLDKLNNRIEKLEGKK